MTLFAYPCASNPKVSLTFAGKDFAIDPKDLNFGRLTDDLGIDLGDNILGDLLGGLLCVAGIAGADLMPGENFYVVGKLNISSSDCSRVIYANQWASIRRHVPQELVRYPPCTSLVACANVLCFLGTLPTPTLRPPRLPSTSPSLSRAASRGHDFSTSYSGRRSRRM